jgi:hypothetical protein
MGGIAHTQKVRHHIFGCEEEFDSAFECAGYNIMAKKVRQGRSWSMQTDRELIALSKTHALEALADQLQLHRYSIGSISRTLDAWRYRDVSTRSLCISHPRPPSAASRPANSGHARAYPPTISRTPGLLARLLRRRPCRHDRAPHRLPDRRRSMGVAVRLLSGHRTRRAPGRYGDRFRVRPRRLRSRLARGAADAYRR